jgi:hypothetical protein
VGLQPKVVLAPLLLTIFAVLGNTVAYANLISTAQVSFLAGGFGAGGCAGPPVNVPSPIASSACSTSRTLADTTFIGSASASAEYGSLGVLAIATLSPGGVGTAVETVTEARLADVLTFTGAGIASLAIVGQVSGSTSSSQSGALTGSSEIFQINIDGANPTNCFVLLPAPSNAPTGCTTPRVPISNGSSLGFAVLLEASIAAFYTGLSGTGSSTITADYSHTGRVAGIEVFDANGNLLTNVTVTSGSGFAYPIGFPPAAIPEPGSLLLFASGFAGLAGVSWRRRRK